jgi:tetratricopeptide (TPR) repeat protein
MADSDSDDSFHSIQGDENKTNPQAVRFTPEEEASLLTASNDLKTAGNQQFGSASYSSAIQTYDRALAQCPNYLDYELAVLRSNIAACHLQLSEWKEAIESAEKGIDGLERLEPLPKPKPQNDPEDKENEAENGTISEITDAEETRIHTSTHPLDQIRKLQTKLLLRRAKANTNLSSWSSLQAADEDYRLLLSPPMEPCLSTTDKKTVVQAARALAPKLNAAKEKEMAEMMGKLKGLGNSILKPFGLSTENFKFEQQEGGGYAMNFDQGAGKK